MHGDICATGAGEEDVIGVLVVGCPVEGAVAWHGLATDGKCVLHGLEDRGVIAIAASVSDARRSIVPCKIRLHGCVNPRITVPEVLAGVSEGDKGTCISS